MKTKNMAKLNSFLGCLFLTSLFGVVSTSSGCVTTESLKPEQCQSADWKSLGYKDGALGRSGAYFGKYVNDCSNISGALPKRQIWEQGRQAGLKEYCTELNAYKLGREGSSWQPVCPVDGIEKLEDAYSQGRYYYLRQRDIDFLTTPHYPFYYPQPHWRRPFVRPVW